MAFDTPKAGLADVLGSRALARLLLHFAVHPDPPMHFRALQRHTGLGNRSLQKELEKLAGWGVLVRESEGGTLRYRLDDAHPRWRALRELVRSFAAPAEVLREALADVGGVQAAFVFGSTARGDAAPDSDVDLFVLGDEISSARLGRETTNAALLLDREVDVKRFTRAKLDRLLREGGGGFVAAALAGAKQWVVGSESTLAALAP